MLNALDRLVCEFSHARWLELVSYSRQGAWRCTKPVCRAQAQHDRQSRAAMARPLPLHARQPGHSLDVRRAARSGGKPI